MPENQAHILSDEQKNVVQKALEEKNYSNIAEIVAGSASGNEKYQSSLETITHLAQLDLLNISSVAQMAEILKNHASATVTALEDAYAQLVERLGGHNLAQVAPTNSMKSQESEVVNVSNLDEQDQIKSLAESLTVEQISNQLAQLQQTLRQRLESNSTDNSEIMQKIALLKQTSDFKKNGSNTPSFSVLNNNTNLEDIETRKPIRVVEGFGVVQGIYNLYQEKLEKPEDDNPARQAKFFLENKLRSERGSSEQNEESRDSSYIAQMEEQENLARDIRSIITAKTPVTAEDIEYTDDVEYIINGGKLTASKDENRKYVFTITGEKKGMNFVLSVHRVDDHGVLIPDAYDLIQYVDGEPIAMISSSHSSVGQAS